MTAELQTALLLLLLLEIKHLFADFFLQTPRMLSGRGQYAHLGRAQHAGLHAAFSVCALLICGAPLVFVVILCLAELVVHYHIDWAKGVHSDKTGYTPTDPGYWRAFGVDQFLHQLTYIAMVWAWAVFTL